MNMPDTIEFYIGNSKGRIAFACSTMVPPADSFISIRGVTYKVVRVTYALDYADNLQMKGMRANVVLEEVKKP